MADRKASVSLELRASQFKAEATSVESKIEGVDRKVEKLDRDITKIPRDAAAASAAMRLLGDDAGRSALKLEDLGKSSTSMGLIDQRILRTRGELRRLAEEFDKTGDAGILQKLFKSGNELKDLERLKKRLTNALESGVKDATALFGDLFSSIGDRSAKGFFQAFSAMPPEAQVAIAAGVAGVVAVTAPAIGASVTGILLGAVGASGLGLAIAGQISNPAVQAAAGEVAMDLKAALAAATSPMAGVLVGGMREFDRMVTQAVPGLQHAFGVAAPDFQRFLSGMVRLVQELLPGFEHALVAGGRILGQLGEVDLPALGRAFGFFFDSISRGSTGAGLAVHVLFGIIEGTLMGLGLLLETMSKAFSLLSLLSSFATGDLAGFSTTAVGLATDAGLATGPVTDLGTSIGGVGAKASITTGYLAGLNDELDTTFHRHMDADRAALQYNESLTALSQSIKDNGMHWEDNTAAGQRNWAALQAAIEAADRKRQADVANGKDAIQAALQFNAEAQQIWGIASAAGVSKTKLDAMAGNYTINVTEIRRLITVAAKAASVDRSIEGLTGRASGGPVMAGQSYIVGEHRPELFTPTVSGYITPSVSSYAAPDYRSGTDFSGMRPSAAMGGAGGQTVIVNAPVTVNAGMGTDGAALGAQIAERLRPYISSLGGNVQQALGKRGR